VNLFSLTTRAFARTMVGTASMAWASLSASMMAQPVWSPSSQPQSKYGENLVQKIQALLVSVRRLDEIPVHRILSFQIVVRIRTLEL
jgi:hypothetical protein